MIERRSVISAALLTALASTAHAQNPATPAQPQAVQQQGSMPEMGSGRTMGMRGTMSGGSEQRTASDGGIVGIVLTLDANAVGAPARLAVRSVEPGSPAYYAGIVGGDRIVMVDGQPVDGKALDDVANAIRGEAGSTVKLSLDRQGRSRDVTLTRVEPVHSTSGRRETMRMHRDMMGFGPRGEPGRPE